jgi:hypothetical protein
MMDGTERNTQALGNSAADLDDVFRLAATK